MTFSASSVFITIFIVFLFHISNVRSDFSFNFRNFKPDIVGPNIAFAHDAQISENIIQLTKKNEYGDPLPHSVGQSVFTTPICIYDKSSDKVADFTTKFSFVVDRRGRNDHGDGMTFFMRPPAYNFPGVEESGGGFLGIFTHKTNDPSKTTPTVVAIEFDSFANEWDPFGVSQTSHLGMDVGSVVSEATVPWLADVEPDGTVANATISYESYTQELSVSVTYPKRNGALVGNASLKYIIDLRAFLPEKVQIGFSAATGDLVETHDILSWSFTSNL